jgi:hypothetical protein
MRNAGPAAWLRVPGLAVALVPLMALAACGGSEPPPEEKDRSIPAAVGTADAGAAAVESQFGTPVKDRVATLGLLNKRNNLTQEIRLKSGEAGRIGNVVLRLATCEKTLPWESTAETGAFVQMYVEERARAGAPLAWRKVFSGWLFRNSPSLNVVEHPVYDVWVKDCAMKFPGEEADPAALAAPSKAAKPSGSETAPTPAPESSPAASPSAAASPAPTPAAAAAE